MAAPKTTTIYGLLGKLEPTYGEAVVLAAATDGILLAEPFDLVRAPVHDGSRARQSGAAGPYRRVAPSGFAATGTAKVEMRGAGVKYEANVMPPDIHVLLRASGHSATLDATVGTEKYTYTPESGSYASAAFELYGRGEKIPLTKAYADFGFVLEAGGIAVAEFALSGLPGAITDTAVPAITDKATIPPKGENITFRLTPNGGAAVAGLVVRRVEFRENRAIGARADANAAAGHQGFNPGRFDPELIVVIEHPPLATWNPYTAFSDAVPCAIEFGAGAVKYNRWKFAAPQAYLKQEPEKGEDAEGASILTLRFQPAGSTPVANDHYSLVWD